MIKDRLARFIERNLLSGYVRRSSIEDFPDWLWDAIFELFTHE